MADQKRKKQDSRATRTRGKIKRVSTDRPRLSVFRSSKNISAQIIDDKAGKTLAYASSLESDVAKEAGKGSNKEAAAKVGKALADRAVKAGVKNVVFDRGGYMFHGRVKALADAAREAGLNF